MDAETFFKKLKTPISDEQKAIITADEKPTAVIASAGSGKTTTLINRILYQIEVKKIDPSRILAITFSKAAQQDMQKRFNELSKPFDDNIESPDFRTFHSCFLMLIRENSAFHSNIATYANYMFPLSQKVKYHDGIIKSDVLKRIFGAYSYFLNSEISADGIYYKSGLEAGEEIELDAELLNVNFEEDEYFNVIREYHRLQEENNGIDFDDIQVKLLAHLEKNDMLAQKILDDFKEKYDYYYFDEFQDINDLQWNIITRLVGYANKWNHATAIGDPNQAIYGFRGSDSKVLQDFADKLHGQELYLSTNYRCPDGILNPVLTVIPSKKKAKAFKEGGKVTFLTQTDELLKAIKESKGSTALIARQNAMLSIIVDKLACANVPVKANNSMIISNQKYYKDLIATIALAITHDTKLLARLCNRLFLIGNEKLNIDRAFRPKGIRAKGDYAWQYWIDDGYARVPKKIVDQLYEIKDNQDNAAKMLKIAANLLKTYYDKAIENGYIVDSLVSSVENYLVDDFALDEKGKPLTYEEFSKKQIKVKKRLEMWQNEFCRVIAMTTHGSKGLEFDNVFYIGVTEEVIPGTKGMKQMLEEKRYASFKENFEEERNMFYVSWTRAKKNLFVFTNWLNPAPYLQMLDMDLPTRVAKKRQWTPYEFADNFVRRTTHNRAHISAEDWDRVVNYQPPKTDDNLYQKMFGDDDNDVW